jgi:nucleotide-binding universal stress UspA family protein
VHASSEEALMMNTRLSGIVVGVDGTSAGQPAIQFAMREASRRGCGLEVVTTWNVAYDAALGARPADPRAQAGQAQEAAISAALIATSAPPVISRHVIEGHAGITLVSIARAADYLVVGTSNTDVVKRALLGSVSTYCIQHASCPVMVVPPAKPPARRTTEASSAAHIPQPVR